MGNYSIDDANFTYFLSDYIEEDFGKHLVMPWDNMVLNYTKNTVCYDYKLGSDYVVVLGFCIDSHAEINREDIAKFILHEINSEYELVLFTKRLAGNWVILYFHDDNTFVINDAIGAMQVNYVNLRSKIHMASTDALLGKYLNLSLNDIAIDIYSQATAPGYQLPYDLTFYKDVSIMLPNHFFDVRGNKIVRYWPENCKKMHIDLKQAVEQTIKLQKNIILEYQKFYKIVGSLTSGNDSRVVFALLNSFAHDPLYYTFFNKNLSINHDDIIIPKKIATDYALNYELIKHNKIDEEYYKHLVEYGGPSVSKGRAQLTYSFFKKFDSNAATINGNVFEEIGRNMMGIECPDIFASVSFAMHDSYNYSSQAERIFKQQFKDVRREGCGLYILDIMSLENKCGRWISDSMTCYAIGGCNALNICNCREIIELWMSLDKKTRADNGIHKGIISELDPNLYNYPINPSRPRVPNWKRKWIYTWICSNKLVRKVFKK